MYTGLTILASAETSIPGMLRKTSTTKLMSMVNFLTAGNAAINAIGTKLSGVI